MDSTPQQIEATRRFESLMLETRGISKAQERTEKKLDEILSMVGSLITRTPEISTLSGGRDDD